MTPTLDPDTPVLVVGLAEVTCSSITLIANFTAAAVYSGRFYCAAFPSGTVVTSSSMIVTSEVTSGASVTYLAGADAGTVTINRTTKSETFFATLNAAYCATFNATI